MKMPMADQTREHRGPSEHKQAKMSGMGDVKKDATSGGEKRDTDRVHMNDKPAVRPASKASQLKSGGPGVGAHGGMSHACSTLRSMKE
jgi:hypothetical protein